MLRVEPALFSNVITSVQRTGSLTGGAIRGLPNGVVIEGLKGINSFGSDVAEAQKEYQLGRVRSALERVKQIESLFNGIVARWHSTVGSLISSTRQGKQKLSLQKLNEVKNAQTKMQQLTGPAGKAFQDLVSALEHAVSMEGRTTDDSVAGKEESATTGNSVTTEPETQPSQPQPSSEPEEETPDVNLLGRFAEKYRFGPKLKLRRGADKKVRVEPRLEKDKFYFIAGFDPPRVVRVRELQRDAVLVFDSHQSEDVLIDAFNLKIFLGRGIWILVAKSWTS